MEINRQYIDFKKIIFSVLATGCLILILLCCEKLKSKYFMNTIRGNNYDKCFSRVVGVDAH